MIADMTAQQQWTAVPDLWSPIPDGAFAYAKTRAMTALDTGGDRPVGGRLAAYYDRDGNYAGASFAELFPNDPNDLTATDLHAVSLLSVDIGPGATRRFLDPGPVRSGLLAALCEVPIVELHVADSAVLVAMASFYDLVKVQLGEPTTASSNQWVTASKVCARKRPYLFPVRDSLVCDLLGLTKYSNRQVDWLVFRSLIGDADIIHGCDEAVAAAHRAAGHERASDRTDRRLAVDRDRLRVLDAALWTYARKNAG